MQRALTFHNSFLPPPRSCQKVFCTLLWLACVVAFYDMSVAEESEVTEIPIAELNRSTAVDFHKEVAPLLRRSCLACHNAKDAEGDLVLENRDAMLKGGAEGPAIVPGQGAESLLLQLAAAQREPVMPPAGNAAGAKPLSSEELAVLKLWIDQGAKIDDAAGGSTIAWRPLPSNVTPVLAAAVDGTGTFAATGRGNRLFVYHLPSGRLIQELIDPAVTTGSAAHYDIMQSLSIHRQGNILASGGFQSINIWRRTAEQKLAEFPTVGDATTIAVDGQQRQVAIATTGGDIHVFDMSTKQLVTKLSGHRGAVKAIRWDKEGDEIISGGDDGIVRVWQVATGMVVVERNVMSPVTALLVAVDNEIVVATADNGVRLWGRATFGDASQAPLREFRAHAGPVHAVAYASANTGTLATGSADGTLRLWGYQAGNELRAMQHGGTVLAVDISADGSRVVSAGDSVGVKLWDGANGQLIVDIQRDIRLERELVHEQQELALANAEVSATQGRIGEIEKQIAAQEEGVKKSTEALAAAEKGIVEKQQAADVALQEKTSAENAVKAAEAAMVEITRLQESAKRQHELAKTFWDQVAADVTKVRQAAGDPAPKPVETLVASVSATEQFLQQTRQQQEQLVAAMVAKVDELRNAAQPAIDQSKKSFEEATKKVDESSKAVQEAKKGREDAQINLQQAEKDVIRSKEELVAKQMERDQWSQRVTLRDQSRAKIDQSLNELPIGGARVGFALDGVEFYVGDANGRLSVYDSKTGSLMSTTDRLGGATLDLSSSESSTIVLSKDGNVSLWNLTRPWILERSMGTLDQAGPLQERVLCLDMSDDGRYLAAGSGQPSRSGPVAIFDLESGELVRTLPEAHSDTVYGIEFSRDGKWLATSSADRMARVFDVSTGAVVRTLEGHTHHVLDVAWQANGRTLATSGADNAIKVWNFETGEQARTIVGINKEITSIGFVGITNQTVSTSGDGNARLHDTGNGNVVRTWSSGGDFLYTSDVTLDGKRVISGGSAGTLHVFDGESGTLLHDLR